MARECLFCRAPLGFGAACGECGADNRFHWLRRPGGGYGPLAGALGFLMVAGVVGGVAVGLQVVIATPIPGAAPKPPLAGGGPDLPGAQAPAQDAAATTQEDERTMTAMLARQMLSAVDQGKGGELGLAQDQQDALRRFVLERSAADPSAGLYNPQLAMRSVRERAMLLYDQLSPDRQRRVIAALAEEIELNPERIAVVHEKTDQLLRRAEQELAQERYTPEIEQGNPDGE